MQNVADILDLWPTDADLGRDIGVSYPAVAAWKRRGSIPPAYWRDIVAAARRRGLVDVTTDRLALIHAARLHDIGKAGSVHQALVAAADTDAVPSAGGHFSRFAHLRRSRFATADEIVDHIQALRDEWDRR
ncbi:hypothetical protein [Ancylobacter lacus]|uniref:hypothetical protein n=1 Tax=Ancylobacter lacus TaxID=2579970 RepID=UPI001BCB87C9|nr:hypothetical protein [Ancylobacter lacus]MBS7540488.1 hypothetical protein [Ancylobacter lacus]